MSSADGVLTANWTAMRGCDWEHRAHSASPLDVTSVGVLVAKAREGDTGAFTALLRDHQGRAYSLARRIVGDPDEAADVTQDAFVLAFRHLGKFRGECAFGSWLSRIVINVALRRTARLRARRAATAEMAESSPGKGRTEAEPSEVTGPSLASLTAARQRRELIMSAISKLPAKLSTCVLLFYFEGYSQNEAAEILGVPVGTVASRLHHARRRLAKMLPPDV
jgi:RNA polymerase sigma-70 factor (ECF subfamily)